MASVKQFIVQFLLIIRVEYTNGDYADMHFLYGSCNGNATAADEKLIGVHKNYAMHLNWEQLGTVDFF